MTNVNNEKLIKDLEEILNGHLDPTMFPYQKGNSIRIGKYIVRSSKCVHKIFDCESNSMLAETFSKSAAVALAKTLSKGNPQHADILSIDKDIQKWYNDCIFYKHIMSTSKDSVKLDITETRLDIARYKTSSARQSLDKYIYSY